METTSNQYSVLNDAVIDAIAAIKLPFSAKEYYAFSDKYLPHGADEDLYLDEDATYYREIVTDYDDLKYIAWLSAFFVSPVFCDIGCGIGNMLVFASKTGCSSFGYEINTLLQRLHKKIKADVVYGDILSMDLSRLATADIIYLYRPIGDDLLMDKVFELVCKHSKADSVILYNYPHSLGIAGYETIVLSRYDKHILMLLKNQGTFQQKVKHLYCS